MINDRLIFPRDTLKCSTAWNMFVIFSAGTGVYGRSVRFIDGFPFAHVVIAGGGRVLTANLCRMTGNRAKVATLAPYLWAVKGLGCVFWVPVDKCPTLTAPNKAASIYAAVLRWITRGLTPARDCVSLTCHALRDAGIAVPRRICSPRQLHRWLETQGFAHDTFDSQGTDHPACGYPVLSASGVRQSPRQENPARGRGQGD